MMIFLIQYLFLIYITIYNLLIYIYTFYYKLFLKIMLIFFLLFLLYAHLFFQLKIIDAKKFLINSFLSRWNLTNDDGVKWKTSTLLWRKVNWFSEQHNLHITSMWHKSCTHLSIASWSRLGWQFWWDHFDVDISGMSSDPKYFRTLTVQIY